MEFKEARETLTRIANDIVYNIKLQLTRSGKSNTGNLVNSVRWRMDTKGNITITAADYFKYVVEGVQGTKVSGNSPFKFKPGKKSIPMKYILTWLTTSNGSKFYNKVSKKMSKKSAAFILSRSIHEKGIKRIKSYEAMKAAQDVEKTKYVNDLKKAYAIGMDRILNEKTNKIY